MAEIPEGCIDSVLNIWPVTRCLASYSGVGDLISISRTNSTIRAVLHGFNPLANTTPEDSNAGDTSANVRPSIRIGKHQTRHWANLKRLAFFECASLSHTKGDNVHPCKYCSMPICEACIVRSSFANPHENTFKNRTRFLCSICWQSGNLRKDHRHPADHVSREYIWRGRNYSQRGSFCTCTAKNDAWLCLPCKNSQNNLAPVNGVPVRDQAVKNGKSRESPSIECYGVDCTNLIRGDDRDRRRICLWCSKPLPRQYGGEDRLRWDSRVIEARANNAASRSADIEEWARNRFKNLTMSRREMRDTLTCIELSGFDDAEHDKPQFVRHLDAVNYRAYLPDNAVPEPEIVWRSKNGTWIYRRDFLEGIGRLLQRTSTNSLSIDTRYLQHLTGENGLKFARTNRQAQYDGLNNRRLINTASGRHFDHWTDLKARILQLVVVEKLEVCQVQLLLMEQYDVEISDIQLQKAVDQWRTQTTMSAEEFADLSPPPSPSTSSEDRDSGSCSTSSENDAIDPPGIVGSSLVNGALTSPISREADFLAIPDTRGNVDPHAIDIGETEGAMLEHALQESLLAGSSSDVRSPNQDDPPPYSP